MRGGMSLSQVWSEATECMMLAGDSMEDIGDRLLYVARGIGWGVLAYLMERVESTDTEEESDE